MKCAELKMLMDFLDHPKTKSWLESYGLKVNSVELDAIMEECLEELLENDVLEESD